MIGLWKKNPILPHLVGMTGISLGALTTIAFAEEPGIGAMWLDSAVMISIAS